MESVHSSSTYEVTFDVVEDPYSVLLYDNTTGQRIFTFVLPSLKLTPEIVSQEQKEDESYNPFFGEMDQDVNQLAVDEAPLYVPLARFGKSQAFPGGHEGYWNV